ncbi:RNA-guided endonuclease TnpB family protein [Nocardia sp. NPDC050799]|uniref:RNA-guided endonuclease InsQ/TnpB family protein n=1 Tax=Nocardia sp. NPDC050799 TaxID=3154842 RepID=UPI0033C90B91
MSRHTAFRYCLDPTVEQQTVLARHAGATRFAYNQCLAIVKTALTRRRTDPEHPVPWTRFDLINAFNTWKKSAAAAPQDHGRWVGIDRGLSAFLVAATGDGREVVRIDNPPKPPAGGLARQRRLAKAMSRKEKGSRNRREAAARLARHHHRVANVRRHFLHQVTNQLVKIHDRLVVEDLHVAGMLHNRRLARSIADAGWADFERLLNYKLQWRGGTVVTADRWFPSSKRCPACGTLNPGLTLADRVFTCPCGYRADRDLNAAVNLAAWPRLRRQDPPRSPDLRAGGRVINARRQEGADRHPMGAGATGPDDAGTKASIPIGM